jgi:hypothetical protein
MPADFDAAMTAARRVDPKRTRGSPTRSPATTSPAGSEGSGYEPGAGADLAKSVTPADRVAPAWARRGRDVDRQGPPAAGPGPSA